MEYEFTFLLPCLNEERSIEYCINEIKKCIDKNNLNAEILVSDNGSTDESVEIAKRNGARVEICKEKGYGNALINGTIKARGKYCIMGDSDGSYDFFHLDEFIKYVRQGYDLVVGNRYKGGIEQGAMKLSHRFGVIALSGIANMFFRTEIKDFHCGLRAFNTDSIKELELSQGGMEYASEMIIMAKIKQLKMIEVPTVLRKDLRKGGSHLRTVKDGIRHVILIFKLLIKRKYIRK